jgi:hypothetical protein
LQNCHRLAEFLRNIPDHPDFFPVFPMGSVGKIQAGNVHTVKNQFSDNFRGTARRADGADNFGLWH